MYVEISPPKSRHSDPRNSHIASLLFDSPVVVWCTTWSGASPPVSASAAWTAASAMGRHLQLAPAGWWRGLVVVRSRGGGLQRPAVDGEKRGREADRDHPAAVDHAVGDDRQGERHHDRPVGGRRHV